MRAKMMLAAALAGVLAASACSSGEDKAEAGAEGSASPSSSSSPTVSASPVEQEPVKEPVVLAFGGDVHFEGHLRGRLGDPKTALGPIASTLRKADLAMVNLETAITTGGTPAPGKQFVFRAPATAFTALRAAGVDVVSMANNHGMDFMETGLADSLKAIKKSKFPTVGIGRNAKDAYAPYRTTIKGNRIAILGATQVLDDHLIPAWTATGEKGGLASAKDASRMVQAVKQARKGSDLVIVHLHWGEELNPCPLPRQKELARQLVKLGFGIYATRGTSTLLWDAGIKTQAIYRISRGRPNLLDLLHEKQVQWIVNTTENGAEAMVDEIRMRSLAVSMGIPVTTTLSGLTAAIEGLTDKLEFGRFEVCSLQEYHRHVHTGRRE